MHRSDWHLLMYKKVNNCLFRRLQICRALNSAENKAVKKYFCVTIASAGLPAL